MRRTSAILAPVGYRAISSIWGRMRSCGSPRAASGSHGSAFQKQPRMPDWCSGDLADCEIISSSKQPQHAGFGTCVLNIERMAAETGACL